MPLHSAYQHTRCWMTLTALKATLHQFRADGEEGIDKYVLGLLEDLKPCITDVRRKDPSAGAMREMKAACARMETYMSLAGLSEEGLFRQWTANMWASLTLLEDCKNTCPMWFAGRHWRILLRRLTEFCEGLRTLEETDPELVPELGTALYEKIMEAA